MFIKRLLPYRTKYRLLLFLQQFKKPGYFKNLTLDPNKRYAFVFLAADYGNLGDIAITYAQTQFIQRHSGYEAVEIPISKSLEGLVFVRRYIRKNDIVTTVGGGNLGDLYDQIEFIRQLVVSSFPNNKIISFPQTFDFANSKLLGIARRVYGKHKDLYLIAREMISYQLMKQHFPNNKVLLTPDIVLSLTEQNGNQRDGALICMRDDKEKKTTAYQMNALLSAVERKFKTVNFYDTHLNRRGLNPSERMSELQKIWKAFSRSEIVVTDRLHGMVFSYITKTPCIVLPNNNHKISGTYEWIKEENLVRYAEGASEENIDQLIEGMSPGTEKTNSLLDKFQPLVNILN
jgi:pyruvyl transferase EpsI